MDSDGYLCVFQCGEVSNFERCSPDCDGYLIPVCMLQQTIVYVFRYQQFWEVSPWLWWWPVKRVLESEILRVVTVILMVTCVHSSGVVSVFRYEKFWVVPVIVMVACVHSSGVESVFRYQKFWVVPVIVMVTCVRSSRVVSVFRYQKCWELSLWLWWWRRVCIPAD